MSIRSMTGFAQVKGHINDQLAFSLSLKSVNHRFLDLHLRMPADTDALEMKLRRVLKEKLARGHVEVTVSLEQASEQALAINRQVVAGYVNAFRQAAAEFSIAAEPDLNAIFRIPGALTGSTSVPDGALDEPVLEKVHEAIRRLNDMREEEGRGIERELRERMQSLRGAASDIEKLRSVVLRANMDRIQSRLRELLTTQVDQDRVLQEAALAADRSDIQEEVARLKMHL